MTKPLVDIDRLSAAQRLDLIEALWDSLEPEDVPVTAAQKQELDRRLDAPDRASWKNISMDELAASLRRTNG